MSEILDAAIRKADSARRAVNPDYADTREGFEIYTTLPSVSAMAEGFHNRITGIPNLPKAVQTAVDKVEARKADYLTAFAEKAPLFTEDAQKDAELADVLALKEAIDNGDVSGGEPTANRDKLAREITTAVTIIVAHRERWIDAMEEAKAAILANAPAMVKAETKRLDKASAAYLKAAEEAEKAHAEYHETAETLDAARLIEDLANGGTGEFGKDAVYWNHGAYFGEVDEVPGIRPIRTVSEVNGSGIPGALNIMKADARSHVELEPEVFDVYDEEGDEWAA